jgi:hypothetical protein
MNLLNQFVLQQTQYSALHAELNRVPADNGEREAKVEFHLVPRKIKNQPDSGMPAYQVTAKLECRGMDNQGEEPAFKVGIVLEAVYFQVEGEPMSFKDFSGRHGEFTRQLYPLVQQQLRQLLSQLGLEQLKLPADMGSSVGPGRDIPASQLH